MSEEINHDRRRFLGAAAMTLGAARLGMIGSAGAQSGTAKPADVPAIKPGTSTSFGPIKQIDAGVLNVGYVEAGPSGGRAVILLHGWPYDIYSFVDVAPALAAAGYRVIVPYLRGYGPTRFLSSDTFRGGQPAAAAFDTIALMDALKIGKAVLAKRLGANVYIDSTAINAAQALQELGGADVILATAPSAKAMSELFEGLGPNGKVMVLGVGPDPIGVTPVQLFTGSRAIQGWSSGTPADSEDTLRFAALTGVRPMIETYPLAEANEAYARMMSGKAQFRVVLTM